MLDILVIFEVFQLPMLEGPFKLEHPINIADVDVTPDKFGISVAEIDRFEQPRNMCAMLVQELVPHCVTSTSLSVFTPVAKSI
jgi:hypothetical protein